MILFLIVLAVVVVCAQQQQPPLNDMCAGKFAGEPCAVSNATDGQGACDQRARPCASATNCEPEWFCSLTRARLRSDCAQAGDLCLIAATESTPAASSTCAAGCPPTEPTCAVPFHCSSKPASATPTPAPGPTIVLPNPDRAAACRDKTDGARCQIKGKSGVCSFGPRKAKRVPLQLECFEDDGPSSSAASTGGRSPLSLLGLAALALASVATKR